MWWAGPWVAHGPPQKWIFRAFCREDESGRQTFLGAKQEPQYSPENALTSG